MTRILHVLPPGPALVLAAFALAGASGFLPVPAALAQTASSTAPVVSGIVVTPADTTASVTWTTDVPADAFVNYGTSAFYGASTTKDTNLGASHARTIFGLTPGTLYHFQIVSANASGTPATSTDRTFTTLGTTTPAAPVISDVSVTPTDTTALISWDTDMPSDSRVAYGATTSYGSTTPLGTGLVTDHSAVLTGLAPSTLYHFQVRSANASSTQATSSDRTFVTLAAAATSTATSTPEEVRVLADRIGALERQITALHALITTLEQRLSSVLDWITTMGGGMHGTPGTGTSTPPAMGMPRIDQNGRSASVGGSIDFGGHGFASEQDVHVTLNGAMVAHAHADSAGNFSTGSLSVPSTAGTYTYLFTGQRAGDTATAMITVR